MVKLVIGVANFHNRYGVEKKKFTQNDKYKRFIKILKSNKIKIFDTSFDYKLDPLIAKKFNYNLDVITKTKLQKKNLNSFIKKLENKIIFELKKMNLKKFEALLIHNVDDLKRKNTSIFLNKLFELKKKKVNKIYRSFNLPTFRSESCFF